MPILSLNAFLQSTKLALQEFKTQAPTNVQKLNIVIGNQSGDLDSIVSSITYAYYANLQHRISNNNIQTSAKPTTIPILNFKESELKLRNDVKYLFDQLQISQSNICFINDVNGFSTQQKENIDLTLVDHNAIESNVEQYLYDKRRRNNSDDGNVKSIIDHHKDEKKYLNANPRIINMVGSCSVLVSGYWFEKLGLINNNDDGNAVSVKQDAVKKISEYVDFNELVKFAASPVLIDTSNLKFKVTGEDVKIFQTYQSLINDVAFNADEFYTVLKTEKDNIENFSVVDIIGKDYKSYSINVSPELLSNPQLKNVSGSQPTKIKIGITSIVKPLDWLVKRDGINMVNAEVDKFGSEAGINILILMTNYTNDRGEYSRDLAIKPILQTQGNSTGELNANLAAFLEKGLVNHKSELGLVAMNEDDRHGVNYGPLSAYRQTNIKASRKQVAPLVTQVFQ